MFTRHPVHAVSHARETLSPGVPGLLLVLAALTLAPACGQEPQRISRAESRQGRADTPEVLPTGELAPVELSGRIALADELAGVTDGAFYVMLRLPSGQTILVHRYPAGAQSGAQLDFELDESHSMAGPLTGLPRNVELRVLYSPSGFVDVTEGSAEVVLPLDLGAVDAASIHVELPAPNVKGGDGAGPDSRPTSRPVPRAGSEGL